MITFGSSCPEKPGVFNIPTVTNLGTLAKPVSCIRNRFAELF